MIKRLIIGIIKVYKKCLSPLLGSVCRFTPSCADYSVEAINEYGVLRGLWMTVLRIGRCNPLFKGGCDPVKRSIKC